MSKSMVARAIICLTAFLPTSVALVPKCGHRLCHQEPSMMNSRFDEKFSRRSWKNLSSSSLFQETNGDNLLKKVDEKSIFEEMRDAVMNLNDKAQAALVAVTDSESSPLSKLNNLIKFIVFRTSFLLYRIYRGFFVLVPALIFSVLKEIRGGEESELTYKVPNWFQKNFLLKTHTSWGKSMREKVVKRYFEGVTEKDASKISSCFAEEASIRDVCNLSGNSKLVRVATPADLTERCMEFVRAHPDVNVDFYYTPRCGRGASRWVFAHWFETGTWNGTSCGIQPEGTPLEVEGQTRFYVNDDCLIEELVVTRTFTEWEKKLFSVRIS